jgi:uncharacterized membrane-anchored protein
MNHWRTIVLWCGLILALSVVNHGIFQRERILDEGHVVLLELTPVDPRSLMQGDYMALRFTVAEDIRNTLHPPSKESGNAAALAQMGMFMGLFRRDQYTVNTDGYAVLAIDRDGIGRFVRLQKATTPLRTGEIVAYYRERGWRQIIIASNDWFFAEGQAQRYERARYGEFRVAADGTALLVSLRDEQRKPL